MPSSSPSIDYTTVALEKCEQLWFTDADIILQAGTKQFRVHRGILAAQSTVFNDMFSLPQSEETKNASMDDDGVTVVHLPDDELDVYHLLMAIFDPSYYEPPIYLNERQHQITLSVLRLSHKYDIAFLKRRVIGYLDSRFPLYEETLKREYRVFDDPEDAWMTPDQIEFFTRMIPLSIETCVEWILPSLFFLLSQHDLEYITYNMAWKTLAPRFQALFIKFREIYNANRANGHSWLGSLPCVDCENLESCVLYVRSLRGSYMGTSWYSGLTPYHGSKGHGKMFCEECMRLGDQSMKKLHDGQWEMYAKVFKYTSWDKVRDARRSTLAVLSETRVNRYVGGE